MTKEQSTEEVEAEYRATLLRKTNAMKAEEERLDKVAADEKMVTDAEAAKVQRIAEIQEVVEALKPKATEIDISAGDLPMVDPAIDNQGADGKGGSAYTNAKTQKEVDWMEAFLKRNDYSRTEYASTDFYMVLVQVSMRSLSLIVVVEMMFLHGHLLMYGVTQSGMLHSAVGNFLVL